MWVTPFGDPGVNGYVLLTPAFRSLSRPSSSYSSLGIRHKPVFAWPYYLFRSASLFRTSPHFIQAWATALAKSITTFYNLSIVRFSFLSYFKEHVAHFVSFPSLLRKLVLSFLTQQKRERKGRSDESDLREVFLRKTRTSKNQLCVRRSLRELSELTSKLDTAYFLFRLYT